MAVAGESKPAKGTGDGGSDEKERMQTPCMSLVNVKGNGGVLIFAGILIAVAARWAFLRRRSGDKEERGVNDDDTNACRCREVSPNGIVLKVQENGCTSNNSEESEPREANICGIKLLEDARNQKEQCLHEKQISDAISEVNISENAENEVHELVIPHATDSGENEEKISKEVKEEGRTKEGRTKDNVYSCRDLSANDMVLEVQENGFISNNKKELEPHKPNDRGVELEDAINQKERSLQEKHTTDIIVEENNICENTEDVVHESVINHAGNSEGNEESINKETKEEGGTTDDIRSCGTPLFREISANDMTIEFQENAFISNNIEESEPNEVNVCSIGLEDAGNQKEQSLQEKQISEAILEENISKNAENEVHELVISRATNSEGNEERISKVKEEGGTKDDVYSCWEGSANDMVLKVQENGFISNNKEELEPHEPNDCGIELKDAINQKERSLQEKQTADIIAEENNICKNTEDEVHESVIIHAGNSEVNEESIDMKTKEEGGTTDDIGSRSTPLFREISSNDMTIEFQENGFISTIKVEPDLIEDNDCRTKLEDAKIQEDQRLQEIHFTDSIVEEKNDYGSIENEVCRLAISDDGDPEENEERLDEKIEEMNSEQSTLNPVIHNSQTLKRESPTALFPAADEEKYLSEMVQESEAEGNCISHFEGSEIHENCENVIEDMVIEEIKLPKIIEDSEARLVTAVQEMEIHTDCDAAVCRLTISDDGDSEENEERLVEKIEEMNLEQSIANPVRYNQQSLKTGSPTALFPAVDEEKYLSEIVEESEEGNRIFHFEGREIHENCEDVMEDMVTEEIKLPEIIEDSEARLVIAVQEMEIRTYCDAEELKIEEKCEKTNPNSLPAVANEERIIKVVDNVIKVVDNVIERMAKSVDDSIICTLSEIEEKWKRIKEKSSISENDSEKNKENFEYFNVNAEENRRKYNLFINTVSKDKAARAAMKIKKEEDLPPSKQTEGKTDARSMQLEYDRLIEREAPPYSMRMSIIKGASTVHMATIFRLLLVSALALILLSLVQILLPRKNVAL